MQKWFIVIVFLLAHQASAAQSDLQVAIGSKFPNSASEGTDAIFSTALAPTDISGLGGFNELLPYVLQSPNQEDAGSCLYMSLNGIAEWWMAKLQPKMSRDPDGPLHLSERYLMNLAGIEEDQNGIPNWKTDSIFLFNNAKGTVLNSDFRFTKNWYTKDEKGNYIRAEKTQTGAEYGTPYNWIDERNLLTKTPRVPLPTFKRDILFADPESNQWNTGIAPMDIAEKIKAALQEKKAPVHVIYNHYGYWHATDIVGFNDEMENQRCGFVENFIAYMSHRPADLRRQAEAAQDPKEKERLLKSADKAERAHNQAKAAYDGGGGCHTKGVFYVRDSIYGDMTGPKYKFDPSAPAQSGSYSKPIVFLEYDWVRTMANHISQIYIEE